MRNEVLAVSTQQGFRDFLAAQHDAYRAVMLDASGVPRRRHQEAVKELDRLITVWQARTALRYPQAQKGLHHWDGFRAAQAYIADFVSLWEAREYEELARRLDSALRLLGFEFRRRSGEKGWHDTRSCPIGIFHGDSIVTQCLLELYTALDGCLPRVSLALNRDELARWVRDKRRAAGIAPRLPPPAPVPGPRDPARFERARKLLEQGLKPEAVGRAVGVSVATVYRWRKRQR